jgi:hypothetical protein
MKILTYFNKALYGLFTILLFVFYASDKTLCGLNPLVGTKPFIDWLKEPKEVIYSFIRLAFSISIIAIIYLIFILI